MAKLYVFVASFLLLAAAVIASTTDADMDDGGREVLVRIAAPDMRAKHAVVDQLIDLGYGAECPKSAKPYVEVKIHELDVFKLKQLNANYSIVEDPSRAEFLRFIERSQAAAPKVAKRDVDAAATKEERAINQGTLYDDYHSQAQISTFLDDIVAKCPQIARKYSIGKSVNGADLWAVRITDNPDVNEPGEVEFQYIANMHGDEVVGRQLSLYLIYHLCDQYNTPRVKAIVDNTDIHILPTMNPDGFASHRRANSHRTDLNRNFPDQFAAGSWGGSVPMPPLGSGTGAFIAPVGNFEPETMAVMRWMGEHNFAIAANFHGGSVVANYPYDGNRERQHGKYSASPDDELFKLLATSYARNSPTMTSSWEFPGGITNGAGWYVLYGGMQDYAYLWHGSLHITIELSDEKWPAPNTLASFWENNRESTLSLLEQAQNRIWGNVTDCATNAPITTGTVMLATCANCRQQAVKLDRVTGDYHRIILPSNHASAPRTYTLTAASPDYLPQTKTVSVPRGTALPLVLNFCLQKRV
jgi:carboxypeptidase D